MGNALNSHGTKVYRNGTLIGEQRDITPPALQRNTFDTSIQTEEDDSSIVGRRRRGDMSMTINFLPSGEATHGAASGLIRAHIDGSRDRYNLVYPDTSNWMFSGFVTNLAPAAPEDGVLSANVTIKPTGAMAFL